VRYSVINLSQLNAMVVLDKLDTEAILTARMADLKVRWLAADPPAAAAYDVEALEFDPLKINQETAAFFETLVRDRVNQAARNITLAFGSDTDLDAIASRYPGGVPRLPGETDDRYRRRIWLAPNALGPHGTAEAYQFWALSAMEGLLRDASAIRKVQGVGSDYDPLILVTALMEDRANPKPTTAQLLAIRRYIQDEARQGLTDVISVQAPKIRETDYRLRVWFYPGPDVPKLMDSIRTALAALVEAQYWLGQDHTLMAIHAAAALPGVHNAVILEPTADILVEPDWIVKVNNIVLEYAGVTQ